MSVQMTTSDVTVPQLREWIQTASSIQDWMDGVVQLLRQYPKDLEEHLPLLVSRINELEHMQAGLLWFHIVDMGLQFPYARWQTMARPVLARQMPSSCATTRMNHLLVDGWNYTPDQERQMCRTVSLLLDPQIQWPGKTREQVLHATVLPLLRQSFTRGRGGQTSRPLNFLVRTLGHGIGQHPIVGRWVDAAQLDQKKPAWLLKDRLDRLLRAGANLEALDGHGRTALEALLLQGWESLNSGAAIDLLLVAGSRWEHIDLDEVIEPLRDLLLRHPVVRRARLGYTLHTVLDEQQTQTTRAL